MCELLRFRLFVFSSFLFSFYSNVCMSLHVSLNVCSFDSAIDVIVLYIYTCIYVGACISLI